LNLSFWGLVVYLALFFFRPAERYQSLIPLRLALVVPIITLILVFLSRKFRIPKSSEAILFILFFFFSLSSVLISPYFNESLEILPELYKPITLFFLIIMVLDDEKSIKRFVWIILIFTIFDNLGTFIAHREGLLPYRLGSFYGGIGGDPNEYGLHMLMVLPLTIILMKNESSIAKKAFLVFSFFSYSYFFTRTLSRGAMIASAIVFFQLLILQRKNLKYLVLMIALLAFLFYKTPGSFWERMDTITANEEVADGSIRARLIAIEDGKEMIKQSPIFGVGIGAFRMARARLGKFERVDVEHVAHNTYLEIATETGLVNLFIYIAIAFAVIKGSRDSEKFFVNGEYSYLKGISQGLRIGFIAFLFSGFFLSQQYYRFFYIFSGILTSIKILRYEMVKAKV